MLVWPLDWMKEEDVDILCSEATAQGMPAPSLVLVGDAAYDKALVAALVETLCRLRDRWIRRDGLQASAELLIMHEQRGHGVEPFLFKRLRARGIHAQREAIILEGAMEIITAEL